MQEPVLEFRDVSRSFSVRSSWLNPQSAKVLAVNKVSLSLFPGETLGLVGESGCGKSTLARLAVRLLSPSSGEMFFQGESLLSTGNTQWRQSIQMVFQDPFSSLNPRLTVGASVTEPLQLSGQGLSKAELREKVLAMFDAVGLSKDHYKRYPHEFSGGQRQRLAVARALITNPSLVVCDEPVSALDASVQAQVLNLLKDLQQQSPKPMSYLFISHDLGVVGFMSQRVAVMYLGQIVELAPRQELFNNPAHPYTQALLASAPGQGALQEFLTGELPSPLNPPSGCAFHPRCPKVQNICCSTEPLQICKNPQAAINEQHVTRCHFAAF